MVEKTEAHRDSLADCTGVNALKVSLHTNVSSPFHEMAAQLMLMSPI